MYAVKTPYCKTITDLKLQDPNTSARLSHSRRQMAYTACFLLPKHLRNLISYFSSTRTAAHLAYVYSDGRVIILILRKRIKRRIFT